MALASSLSERKRVKVYELRDSDWYDCGTGFCVVRNIADHGRITINSEEDPATDLLDSIIRKDDRFQKQQDTLVVWNDHRTGLDMALSFQETEGCVLVYGMITAAQSQLEGFVKPIVAPPLPEPSLGELDTIDALLRNGMVSHVARDVLVKTLISGDYMLRLLRLVDDAEDLESIDDLHRLCNIMKQMVLYNDNQIVDCLIQEHVFEWAVGALEYDPDFPLHKANHREFLKNTSRFNQVVFISDEAIRDRIHYTYRLQYLKDVALARVLDDPSFSMFNSIIYFHQVDIVQHLAQDTALLTELIGYIDDNDASPMAKKKDAVAFLQQAVAMAKNIQPAAKNNLFHSLINCGLFGAIRFALKSDDANIRVAGTDVLVALIEHDVIMMRNAIYKSASDHVGSMTDTLIDLLLVETEYGVKTQIADAIKALLDGSSGGALLGPDSMGSDSPLTKAKRGSFFELHLQTSMRKLCQTLQGLEDRTDCRSSTDFADLVASISAQEASLYAHLMEILCHFVRPPMNLTQQQHSNFTQAQHASFTQAECKQFILENGLLPRVVRLLECPQKPLKLSVLRFLRFCVINTERKAWSPNFATDMAALFTAALVESDVFDRTLDLLLALLPRDTLLVSACLEIFEYIRQRHLRPLAVYLAEHCRPKLEAVREINTFPGLLAQYELYSEHHESYLDSTPGSTPVRHDVRDGLRDGLSNGRHRFGELADLSPEEEAYFEGDDDDRPHTNGASPHASPLAKPLVDYGDDDEEDSVLETPPGLLKRRRSPGSPGSPGSPDSPVGSPPGSPTPSPSPSTAHASSEQTYSSSSTPPPDAAEAGNDAADSKPVLSPVLSPVLGPAPPALTPAEKRRRHGDDDDELGKLAKRRNSTGSASNAGTGGPGPASMDLAPDSADPVAKTPPLRRKRAFGSGSVGGSAGSAGRKIAISLTGGNETGKEAGNAAGKEPPPTSTSSTSPDGTQE